MKKSNFQIPGSFNLPNPAIILATLTLTACTLFTPEKADLNGNWNVNRHHIMEAGISILLKGKMILVENGKGISGNILWQDTTFFKNDSVTGTLIGDSITLVLKMEKATRRGSRTSEKSFTLGDEEPHVMGSSDIWTCTR